ncbi:hypothetical protein [Pseudomonas fluorescens]|uniref:hypothetical protein n=1 Tax=Pseudomonas fluorescens TaxID=294 RepID=UPI000A63F968|nr:hypothetical protein [Pseudomonas fluorescens]
MTIQPEPICHYRYDALDRLISSVIRGRLERQRYYCKNLLTTEVEGEIRCSIVQHGDQLLAQQQSGGDALAITLLATDQNRTVLQTLQVNNQTLSIAYTPYGIGVRFDRGQSITRIYPPSPDPKYLSDLLAIQA